MGAFLCVACGRHKKNLRLYELALGLFDTVVKALHVRLNQRLFYFGL